MKYLIIFLLLFCNPLHAQFVVDNLSVNTIELRSPDVSTGTDYTQDANILAAWLLDGNSLDETSNNIDGTDTGVTYSAGKYGQAADFDGTNDQIDFGDVTFLDGLTSYTFVMWMKTGTGSVTRAPIKKDGCLIDIQLNSSDHWRYAIWDSGGLSFNDAQSVTLNDNVWHHLAVTWSASENSGIPIFYLDGEVVTKTTSNGQTNPIANSSNSLTLGEGDLGEEDFDGSLDELGYFSRVLSSDEINEIKDNGLKGDQ